MLHPWIGGLTDVTTMAAPANGAGGGAEVAVAGAGAAGVADGVPDQKDSIALRAISLRLATLCVG